VLTAERFERLVDEALAAQIGSAAQGSGEVPGIPEGADLLAAQQALQDARDRLRRNPALRRLAPDGAVTYSDPVLAVASAWAAIADQVGEAAAKGADLTNASVVKWALTGASAWLNRTKREFRDLAARVPGAPFRIDRTPVHIAVVGDAGYSGVAQQAVLRIMRAVHARDPFDVVVHLGDTYFAGGINEFVRHLLAPFREEIDAPFFTLCGNHDLYHGPEGYQSTLRILRQPGRYFEIATSSWRILCLDTSLGSIRTLRNDGKLDPVQLEWLKTILLSSDQRRIILMSHHFILSGWDRPSASLARQLHGLAKDRVFSWYWGHEHRCACYDNGGWGFHGASVGHGAFLEDWSNPNPKNPQPSWYPRELRCACPGLKRGLYWPHGFLELRLERDSVSETYHFEDNSQYQRTLTPGTSGAAPGTRQTV
jgi:Calcineurin-like phosphoesterase